MSKVISSFFKILQKRKGYDAPSLLLGEMLLECFLVQNSTSMKHLTTKERYTIQNMREQGNSLGTISEVIGRHKSTISRELRRNCLNDGSYSACFGEKYAKERAAEKPRRNALTPDVIAVLERDLKIEFSPEQIVGREALLGNHKMPSVTTIYRYIWAERKGGSRLFEFLRNRGKRRKPHGQGKTRGGSIPNRTDISERPPEVDSRKRFGDFECDLIIGAAQSGAIVTVNDRATGLLLMEKIDDKKASTVMAAMMRLLGPYKGRIHTITSDNGSEFARHEEMSKQLGCDYYFARPYHSWERGSNENLNGLIRGYFPKKMNFSEISKKQIIQAQEALNNRPRKRYKFMTPNEYFEQNFKKIDTRCISN